MHVCNCMRLQCSFVAVCMTLSVGGQHRVWVSKCARVWVVAWWRRGWGWSAQVVVSSKRWWMMGQEGKTASQLQIDIPANVFVCCEKWCCNSHLHCPPPPSFSSGLSSLSAVNHTLQSISSDQALLPAPQYSDSTWSQHQPPGFLLTVYTWLSFPCCHRNLPWIIVHHTLILYPFLYLAPPGTAFRENYLSEWAINCWLLL